MLPKFHLIISFLASFIMLIFGINYLFCLLFFLSAFLIDFDHYLYYIIKKRDLSLINAYKYCKYILKKELEKTNQKQILMIFHTAEFFIILLILSLFLDFFLPIFLGCLFHEFTDLVYETTQKDKKYKRAFSLIYYALKDNQDKISKK